MKKIVVLLVIIAWVAFRSKDSGGSDPGWSEDYEQSLAQAKSEKKMVLLNFTGSDWCGWCIKLDKEVFSTSDFKAYADQNLVLVKLDFPRSKTQSSEIKQQNQKLQAQHGIRGFPTIVVLNSGGAKISELGYMPGGPSAFIGQLDSLKGR